MIRCEACARAFSTQKALRQHITASAPCFSYVDAKSSRLATHSDNPVLVAPIRIQPGDAAREPSVEPEFPDDPSYDRLGPPEAGDEPEPGPPLKLRCVCIQEVEDVDDTHAWTQERFPRPVATTHGEGTTPFEDYRDEQEASMEGPYAPFQDRDEWDLVKWLMQFTTQEGIDKFLKLQIVSNPQRWLSHHRRDSHMVCS